MCDVGTASSEVLHAYLYRLLGEHQGLVGVDEHGDQDERAEEYETVGDHRAGYVCEGGGQVYPTSDWRWQFVYSLEKNINSSKDHLIFAYLARLLPLRLLKLCIMYVCESKILYSSI